MFGSLDGQFPAGIEMDDLRHAVKRAAVLTQDVVALFCPRQLHVHEALAAPGDRKNTKEWERKDVNSLIETGPRVCVVRRDNFHIFLSASTDQRRTKELQTVFQTTGHIEPQR